MIKQFVVPQQRRSDGISIDSGANATLDTTNVPAAHGKRADDDAPLTKGQTARTGRQPD
jgi:hypothetical protein